MNAGDALSYCEDFVDKYKNVAMAGLSADVFVRFSKRPIEVNKFAYTCALIDNSTPFKWNHGVEDDLDYNLQILTGKLCTFKFNIINFGWTTTGVSKGGFTDLYADGKRLDRMKKTLEKWQFIPGIVKKGKNGYRLNTGAIWKKFIHKPILND